MRMAITLAISLLVAGCATHSIAVPREALNISGPNGYKDFVPQDPLPSPKITYYDNKTGQPVTKAWAQLSNTAILKILSDTHAQITVAKFDDTGSLTYLVSKATVSAGTYRVIMDYCNYVAEAVTDEQGHAIGQGRVGVGLRLTADVTSLSADINLGSLLALGVAATVGKITGAITVDSIGIRIAGNAGPILTNATIDETSIQKTLEAIAVIQSKIADSTTTLDPQLLAVKPTAPAAQPSDVAKKLL